MDKGNYTAVIFTDLKKVFDTVDHQILLNKMQLYDITRHKRPSSYLDNRKQCCKINGTTSNIKKIDIGVPQGSCLCGIIISHNLRNIKERMLTFSIGNDFWWKFKSIFGTWYAYLDWTISRFKNSSFLISPHSPSFIFIYLQYMKYYNNPIRISSNWSSTQTKDKHKLFAIFIIY